MENRNTKNIEEDYINEKTKRGITSATTMGKEVEAKLAEAKEYEASVLAQAQKEANEITESFEEKAKEASERILDIAKANADGVVSSAQSSQSMRARNSLLAVKVELIEKAYDTACEMIGKLCGEA